MKKGFYGRFAKIGENAVEKRPVTVRSLWWQMNKGSK